MRRVPRGWIVIGALLLVVATTVLGIGPGKVHRLVRALALLPKVAYYTKVGRALQEIRRTELVTDHVVWHQRWSFLPASDEMGIFWWRTP